MDHGFISVCGLLESHVHTPQVLDCRPEKSCHSIRVSGLYQLAHFVPNVHLIYRTSSNEIAVNKIVEEILSLIHGQRFPFLDSVDAPYILYTLLSCCMFLKLVSQPTVIDALYDFLWNTGDFFIPTGIVIFGNVILPSEMPYGENNHGPSAAETKKPECLE